MINRSGSITSSSHAGYQIIRIIASFFFQELFLDFTADDALQAGHHVGIGVWAYGGTDDVEGVLRMTAPVADGLIRGIFQCLVSTFYRINLGTQHFHAFYVDVLPCHVRRSHVDSAGHVHQGTDRSSGHTVLAGTGLGNDARFAHFPCQKDLSDGIIDFVSTGVVEVFPFQVEFTTVFFAQSPCMVERRGAAYIIFQQRMVLFAECFALKDGKICLTQIFYGFIQNLGDVCTAEITVIAFFIYMISFHLHLYFGSFVCSWEKGYKKETCRKYDRPPCFF